MDRNNKLAKLKIYDFPARPLKAQLDTMDLSLKFDYDAVNKALTISDLSIDLMDDHILDIMI